MFPHSNAVATREYPLGPGQTATVRNSTMADVHIYLIMSRAVMASESYQELPPLARRIFDGVANEVLGAMARTTAITGSLPCVNEASTGEEIFQAVATFIALPRNEEISAWLDTRNQVFLADEDLMPPEDLSPTKKVTPLSDESATDGGTHSKAASGNDTPPPSSAKSTARPLTDNTGV